MVTTHLYMTLRFWLFGFLVLACPGWILGEETAGSERAHQLNDTSAEMTEDPPNYLDVADQPGPPDSHEAMHNREFKSQHREKRSFEFLVGLVNNNSKYEVIRSDPELSVSKGMPKEPDNDATGPTKLLLDLLAKIVTYPDNWRQIHQLIRNLDQDLTSSQHILRHHQQEMKKLETDYGSKRRSTTTNKWPNFDEIEASTLASTETKPTSKKHENNKKNFAYHKVTGKPAHLKKNPTAYIAVSAISPKPSELEEDFLLESELHRLKPWKNKRND